MKKELKPIPLSQPIEGDEAWFYRNPKSIDVCIYKKGKGTLVVRIPLKKITPNTPQV
jgi:hypothetical protein